MLHCCKSLAQEKQLLRDIKASERRGEESEDHILSLEEIDRSVRF